MHEDRRIGGVGAASEGSTAFEWRCRSCRVLLGVGHRGRMYLSGGGAQYAVSLPVEAVCRRCDSYNLSTFVAVAN